MKKQSSIEWLEQRIKEMFLPLSQEETLLKDIQQAKEMHKQEIKKCCMETMKTCQTDMDKLGLKTMNDYFNFIYKKTLELDETNTN